LINVLWAASFAPNLESYPLENTVLVAKLITSGNISQNLVAGEAVYFFTKFKCLKLPRASISKAVTKDGNMVRINLSCANAVAPFVWLEHAMCTHFSDNGFLLLPNQPHEVWINLDNPVDVKEFEKQLSVTCLLDTY